MALFASARKNLEKVRNYQPGKPLEELERECGIRNAVKMASNENALGASPKALAAVKKALPRIHRYPDAGCFYLRSRLSRFLGVRPEQLVFGNGSDELLVMAVRAFVDGGEEIVIADPTFLIYEIAVTAQGGKAVKVPMKDFRYDLGSMKSRIGPATKIVFIANPDNPVGTYIKEKELLSFLAQVPRHVVVVLDEAYQEFAAAKKDYPKSLGFLKNYDNIIITRTFSKAYGLSGLRVGYAVTSASVAEALNKVREPFNINLLAQVAATAALDDQAFLKKTVRTIDNGRAYLTKELEKLGLDCVDTVTNFILFDVKRDASVVYEALLRKGVIVRSMQAWGLKNYIRVTIGKRAENERFIRALREVLRAV